MCRTSSISKHTAPCSQVEKGSRAGSVFFASSVDLVFTISELENWASALRLFHPSPSSSLSPFFASVLGIETWGPWVLYY